MSSTVIKWTIPTLSLSTLLKVLTLLTSSTMSTLSTLSTTILIVTTKSTVLKYEKCQPCQLVQPYKCVNYFTQLHTLRPKDFTANASLQTHLWPCFFKPSLIAQTNLFKCSSLFQIGTRSLSIWLERTHVPTDSDDFFFQTWWGIIFDPKNYLWDIFWNFGQLAK